MFKKILMPEALPKEIVMQLVLSRAGPLHVSVDSQDMCSQC